MRHLLCLVALLAFAIPRGWAQLLLPDLGDASSSVLSPQMERKLGESVMRDIRINEPGYVDDPEVNEYLNGLGYRLLSAIPGGRQDFEFFAVREPTINAFAFPGGFVGMHTGLLTAADSESEVASVLAHEITHVTQRHIARLFGAQQKMQLPTMIAMAAAILAARSRPDLASGAAMAAQGAAIQGQLGYSRDFEREADRIGFQTLQAAGFDVRAMPTFFEKLQRFTRISDDGTAPGYLRSHPLTADRVADAQNRAQNAPYHQHADSLEFHLVRAKLRAEVGEARDAVTFFKSVLQDRRFANETAARYGLSAALLRNRQFQEAREESARLRAGVAKSPMIDALAARALQAAGEDVAALALLKDAIARNPYYRPLVLAHIDALLGGKRSAEALATLKEQLRLYPNNPQLLALQAKTYAALGKRLLQHQAQSEVYLLQGNLPAAVEQLQLAQSAGDGDFYELSAVEARLKEVRARFMAETKKPRQ
ncbi:MAG: M48 family peptidase [Betaproteobacteria bacterium]|nr:M48 family peptidase [Betaproteobacteria bacterium]